MIRNEQFDKSDELRPRALTHSREHSEPRTIVIRHGSGWQSLAFLCLCLLLLAIVLIAHQALRGIDTQNEQAAANMARVERRIQQLEAGIGFDSRRRRLLIAMRDRILKTNPRVSLFDAYRYSQLALEASEKYPSVDPLLLLAIGVVESGYDPMAKSRADARGLYQIWPSTGRLLVRALGWNYDESTLYDPEKNTEAAALYLDILFTTYRDPQMVLAEYNGGPLNAGYFRAGVSQLAAETRSYVPRVLELHARLRDDFDRGIDPVVGPMASDPHRAGKTLWTPAAVASPTTIGVQAPGALGRRPTP
jgi:hypothetical protein